MSNQLDKKLDELLLDLPFQEETAAAIKQAFIDDGWVKLDQTLTNLMEQTKVELTRLTMTPTPTYRIAEKQDASGGYAMAEVMTGKEWYDKYESNLKFDTKSTLHQCEDCGAPHNWEEAAKKASGIN